jgi:hypothetical protein
MSQIVGYYEGLETSQIREKLGSFGGLKYAILDSITKYQILFFEDVQEIPEDAQALWFFNTDLQLHFQKEFGAGGAETWRLVFIGNREKLPDSFQEARTVFGLDEEYTVEEQQVLLWGERRKGQSAWYDLHVPHVLAYPLKDDPPPYRVGMDMRVYYLDGRVSFVQYLGLTAWERA